VQARIAAGAEYLTFHTLDDEPEQLELIARHIVEPFRGARANAGNLARPGAV
jgi:hypothetical protein